MPEISRFHGIAIAMYFNDHPPPHFHARYGGLEVVVLIGDGKVIGRFPPRQVELVLRWYNLHREELSKDWERARRHEPLLPIEPLVLP
ncbi:MAG: DUF4160 domain-containing protein [Planctomycetota bacterium]